MPEMQNFGEYSLNARLFSLVSFDELVETPQALHCFCKVYFLKIHACLERYNRV